MQKPLIGEWSPQAYASEGEAPDLSGTQRAELERAGGEQRRGSDACLFRRCRCSLRNTCFFRDCGSFSNTRFLPDAGSFRNADSALRKK